MKTICIVDDLRPLWAEIEGILADVNARISFIDEQSAAEMIKDEPPDLVVMGPLSYAGISPKIPPVRTLVIDDRRGPTDVLSEGGRRHVTVAGWPMEAASLLSLTSELLSVAERRFFKALIRIYPDARGKSFHMGESRDFSLTGLSFSAARVFARGQNVEISFFIPKARRHLRIGVEIMRSFPHQSDDKVSVYGCRFVDLDPEARDLIVNFVLGPSH